MTMPALLEARAAQWPDQIALEEKRRGIWDGWSWTRLSCAVRGFAGALQARGFGPGDRLIVMGEASVAWIIADLAAQRLGAASVTPPPDMTDEALGVALRGAAARFAAVDGVDAAMRLANATGLDPAGFFLLRPEAGAPGSPVLSWSQSSADAPRMAPAAQDVATIAFGLGENRAAALAPLTHQAILQKASAVLDAIAPSGGLHALVQVPLAHPAERIASIAALLVAGGRLSFPERVDTVGDDLGEARPRCLSALPWQWRELRRNLDKRFEGAPAAVLALWGRRMAGGGGLPGRLLAASLRRRLGLASVRTVVAHGGGLTTEDLRVLQGLGLDVVEGDGRETACGWSRLRRNGGAWSEVEDGVTAVRMAHANGGRSHAVSG